MKRFAMAISLVIACTVVTAVSASAQSNTGADKIKRAVEKVGVRKDITVVRSDDRWFYGSVEEISDTSFTVYDIEQKTNVIFGYDQVKSVYKGYGSGATLRRDVNGHRIPPKKRHIGYIAIGALAAALAVILAVGLRGD